MDSIIKTGCFIITPDDEIWGAAYNDYNDVGQMVGGYTQCLATKTIYSEREEEDTFLDANFICNDSFLVEKGFDKCNAIVSAILRKPIYGNVVLLPRDDDNDRGFTCIYRNDELQMCEFRVMKEFLAKFVKENSLALQCLHKEYDRITQASAEFR